MNRLWLFITDHKIEVGTVMFLICMIFFLAFTIHSCVKDINEARGIRTMIVESGKEIKLMAKDIDKAVEEHYESERNDPYR